jgi:hypothetical protein
MQHKICLLSPLSNINLYTMKNLFICFVTVLFACNSSTDTKQTTEEKTMSMDSLIVQQPASTVLLSTLATDTGKNCVRGVAEPVIKKNIFPKNSFQLQADKLTGIETVELDNGDKLIIKQWGCGYYALTFRFETERFQNEPGNVGFWYKRAVTFINEVAKGIDSPLELTKTADIVAERIEGDVPNEYKNLKYGEEMDVTNGDIREFVSIDKVEQLSDKKYAIEITVARGPL